MFRARSTPLPRLLKRPGLLLLAAVAACALGTVSAYAYPMLRKAAPALSVKITTRPATYSKSATATFKWKRVSATATTCRLDKAAYKKCKTSMTYKTLPEGRHAFSVRVNRGRKVRVATVRWTVDLTRPTVPTVTGGSPAWVSGSETVSASGSTDVTTSVAGYQFRASANGISWGAPAAGASKTVTASGASWYEFRAVDRAGNVSAPWTPAVPVNVDNAPPSQPVVTGGGSAWQDVAQADVVVASPSVDALSGLAGYRFRSSADNGATWSSWTAGTDAAVTAEGITLVQFESGDLATPANWSAPKQTQVKIDRTDPTDPVLTGGGPVWQSAASVKVTASGATDSPGSGVSGYQYETSPDGATWSAAQAGTAVTIGAEGQTFVQFRAVDASGLTSNWVGTQVWLDRTAPTAPALAGGSSGWQNVASVAITASGSTDTGGSGLAGYQYETSAPGGSWSAPAPGPTATVAAEGQTLVRFRAVDNLGNASAWTQATAMIDRTPPTDPVLSGVPAGWVRSNSVTLSASSTDSPGSGIGAYLSELSIDGGSTWSSPVTGPAVTITGEGATVVRFEAVDASGLTSSWTQATVQIDRTLPGLPTVTGGTGLVWVNTPSVTVTGGGAIDPPSGGGPGSGIDHYQYRTSADGGATWSPVTTGTGVTVTAQGTTIAEFRAVDAAGNVGPWTGGAADGGSWVMIDRGTPTAPAVSGGSLAWQPAASDTILATGSTDAVSGVTGYQSRTSTDSGSTWSAASATGSGSLTVSAEGETWVQFRSVDGAGNTSAWAPSSPGTAADTVRLDHTAPSVPATVSGGSAAWQSVASVTITAGGATDALSGIDHYQHRTSADAGGTWSAVATGAAVTISAEADSQAEFRAVDGAGNAGAWTAVGASAMARIDRTAPTVPAVAGGAIAWQSAASVTVSASGSGDSLSGLAAPGYAYETSLNGGAWSVATAGTSATVSAEGTTTVRFRSIDNAGNVSAWSTVGNASTVKLDRTPPAVPASVSGGSSAWASVASKTIIAAGGTDSGSGVSGYQYETAFNGGAWSAPAAGASVAVSAEGTTTVQFRTVDNAGNTSAWSAVAAGSTVKLDRTGPAAATASGGSLSWLNSASETVTGSATDTGSGIDATTYQYRTSTTGGSTWSLPTSGSAVTVAAEGETLVQFRASDIAGNPGAWGPAADTAGATVRLDRGLPTAPTVAGGSAAWTNAASVTITATGSTDSGSGLAGYQSRTSANGGSSWSAWSATGAGSLAVASAGTTLVEYRSVDNAGNTSAAAPAANGPANTVSIDRTLPTLPTTVSGGSGSWLTAASTTITASGSTDSGGAGLLGYQYETSFQSGAWSAPASGSSVTISAEGQTKVQFRSIDNAGNTSAWTTAGNSSTAKLDRTAPTLPTITGGWGTATCKNTTIQIKASGSTDATSGLAGYRYRYSTNNGTSWSTTRTSSQTFLRSAGTYIVEFESYDSAGNTSAWAPTVNGTANTACHS